MAVPATHVWQGILENLRTRYAPQIQQWKQNHPQATQIGQQWRVDHPNWKPGQFLTQLGQQAPPPPGGNPWPMFGQPGSATVSAALPVPPSGMAPPGTIPINDGNGGVRYWNPVTQQFSGTNNPPAATPGFPSGQVGLY